LCRREEKQEEITILLRQTDLEGPWSDPVFVEGADGIDSSLFFDEDGSVWYVGNYICKRKSL